MDRTTEAISHFAGSFDLAGNAARIRIDLPDGSRQEDAEADPPAIHTITTHFRFPHQPEGFDPGLGYAAIPLDPPAAIPADFSISLRSGPDQAGVFLPDAPRLTVQDMWIAPSAQMPQGDGAGVLMPVPNSYAVVTIQVIRLSDDDIHLQGGWADFADPAVAASRLEALSGDAAGAHAFALPDLSDSADGWAAMAAASVHAVSAGDMSPLAEGLEVTTLRGGAASGTVVDGAVDGEMPLWSDLRPAHLRAGEADRDEGPKGPGEAEADGALPASRHQSGPADGAGGSGDKTPAGLVTGGNEAVNEVVSTSHWVDAPIISVMGDVWKIDAITQVAMLRDRDSGPDGEAVASRATNAAEITETSSNPEAEDGAAGDGLPASWSVTRIDGDLVALNKLVQNIRATDNDRVEVVSGERESFLSTGENVLQDAASLLAYGFQYDLIVVGGDMVDISMIRQTNVLLDDDTVTGGPGPAGASSGDNSLLNAASLTRTGIDTFDEISDALREAGAELAAGARDLSGDLARDAMFTGLDALHALYIEGDFVEIDLVEQSIAFSDADQVAAAIGGGIAAAAAAEGAILGSNAQANIARLHDEGLDSTIMAGGEVYSDALIHQARLVDADADPPGGTMPGLAAEAVAFLADGMIEPWTEPEQGGPAIVDDGGSPFDILQTMLA